MSIRDIDWGEDAAEQDYNLMRYYVESTSLSQLQKKKKRLIVGRKGAGKSALRKKLETEFNKNIKIQIIPNENVIKAIINDERIKSIKNVEVLFQYIWLEHIYGKIFVELAKKYRNKFVSNSKEYIINYSREHGSYNLDFFQLIESSVSDLSLKLGNLGEFSLKVEREILTNSPVDVMEFHLKNVLPKEKDIVIFIDDLDLGWDNSDTSNDLLLGLLNAINHLKNFSDRIHPFVFLRSDMYRILMSNTQHSDKFRDVLYISWDDKLLKKLIEKRIQFNNIKNSNNEMNLFSKVFPEKVGKSLTINWMLERTLNRPRELIQLCKLYTENLPQDFPHSETMSKIESTYSTWKLEDVANEFRNEYPKLYVFLENWKKYNHKVKYHMTVAEFNEKIQVIFDNLDLNEEWYDKAKSSKNYTDILKILYEIGIIGDFVKGGVGGSKVVFKTHDDSHEPMFNEVQIHSCFRKALGTVQRIRKT